MKFKTLADVLITKNKDTAIYAETTVPIVVLFIP